MSTYTQKLLHTKPLNKKFLHTKLFVFSFIFSLILTTLILFPRLTLAETRITVDPSAEITYWNKSGSPYILEQPITVTYDRKLVIGPGVVVMSASTTEGQDPNYIGSIGDMEILGTKDNPVHIIGLGVMTLGKDNRIEHTIFERTGLYTTVGTTTILSSKIYGANTAIEAIGSILEMHDSEIFNNQRGVISTFRDTSPVLMYKDRAMGIGGIGNAGDMDPEQSIITITNNIIKNNTEFDIRNFTTNVIDATDNWWGSADGPGIKVSSAVVTDPWKMEDPVKSTQACCSNVLFLPGLQASRLYRDDPNLLGTGTSTHRAWEPYTNNDVRTLFLDIEGKSINPSIHTSDIMNSAYGLKNVYTKFVAMMNSVVADKTINSWLPFAYDWRMSQSDTSTMNLLIEETEKLAKNSKTGKVTIIAHSNGGLVAKMLGYELEKKGKAGIVDKMLFVAVPHLGTPSAVAAMLHGDNQSILGGVILSDGVARTLGINMSSAYGLLPSTKYFSNVVDPIVTFANKAVGSYDLFKNFLTGRSDNRTQPIETDLKTPAVLSSNLLEKSEWIHQIIDGWNFPTTTDVSSIVGWGVPTTQTIEYSSTSPRIKKSPEGDGTVVAESAGGYGDKIYFNQKLFEQDTDKDVTHAYILEADPVVSMISKSIATSSLASAVDASLSTYISTTKPNPADYEHLSWITVSVHSPVDIDIYDSHGGHFGVIPFPLDPSSDLKWLENTIGAQYDAIGDEKYVTLPADDMYDIKLKGTGTGNFTFQIQKFVGGEMTEVANTVYTDLPVTPLLVASTTISSTNISPTLNLDVDGNGVTDIKVASSTVMDPLLHLKSMKTIILSLKLKSSVEKVLLKKIDNIQKLIKKGKTDKVAKRLKNISYKVENKHWDTKKMTENQRQTLVDMFDSVLSALERE